MHAYRVATQGENPCDFAGQNRPRLAVSVHDGARHRLPRRVMPGAVGGAPGDREHRPGSGERQPRRRAPRATEERPHPMGTSRGRLPGERVAGPSTDGWSADVTTGLWSRFAPLRAPSS